MIKKSHLTITRGYFMTLYKYSVHLDKYRFVIDFCTYLFERVLTGAAPFRKGFSVRLSVDLGILLTNSFEALQPNLNSGYKLAIV